MRRALVLAAALLAVAPAVAAAHAQLEGASPSRGAVLRAQPAHVVFRFSEAVEGAFGAVRVFDASARRVDDGRVTHPGGASALLAVGLRPRLPQGTYTATYRVISADGHPVSGGLVFSIGRAGAAPAKSVDELIGATRAGPVTRAAQRAVHAVEYLATALGAGLVAFLLLCWPRATPVPPAARGALLTAAAIGAVAGLAGLVLEGAIAGGTTFWDALDTATVREVLHTRFGQVWGVRELVWVALAAAVAGPRSRAVALAVPAAALVVAPALEGHSATISPTALLIPADVLHVAAMAVWLGGLLALLLVVPRATRGLEDPADRSRLLAAILGRFSPLAFAAVVTLGATGAIASVVLLTELSQLTGTGYGRELLAKLLLLVALAALGAVNRRRVVPQLQHFAQTGAAPGAPGRLLRTTVRAEVALLLAVLGISGVLVDGVPPVSAASGPFSASKRVGPLDLELTIDPARPGANALHVYLFTAKTGAPFTATKELTVTAELRSAGIGPLPVTMHRAGPGHYTADAMQLAPGGDWTVAVTDRVSAFDEYATTLDVPI